MRTIVIGDVHGCLHELKTLLEQVEYKQGVDRVILAGDLVDRGPDSAGVVQFARTNGLEMILGNHDEWHVRLRKHVDHKKYKVDYKIPMHVNEFKAKVQESLTAEDVNYLASAKPFIRLGNKFIVVHGGLQPKPPEDQDPKIMVRLRYMDDVTCKPKSLGPGFSQPEGTVYWTSKWKGPEIVLYGHNVHSLEQPWETRTEKQLVAIGLDTGACFGGYLSAIVIEHEADWKVCTIRYEQVKATTNILTYEDWAKRMPGEE